MFSYFWKWPLCNPNMYGWKKIGMSSNIIQCSLLLALYILEMCVFMWAHVCVAARGQLLVSFLWSCPPWWLRQCFSMVRNFLSKLDLLQWGSGFCLFPPPQCWFTSYSAIRALLTWASGIEVRSLGLYRLSYLPKWKHVYFLKCILSSCNAIEYMEYSANTKMAKYNALVIWKSKYFLQQLTMSYKAVHHIRTT